MGLVGLRLSGCIWCLNGIRLSRRIGRPLARKFRTVLGGLLRLDLRTATTHFSLSDRDASGTLILLQSPSGVPRGHRIAARPGSRVDRKLDTSWNSGAPRRGNHLNSADLPTIRNPSSRLPSPSPAWIGWFSNAAHPLAHTRWPPAQKMTPAKSGCGQLCAWQFHAPQAPVTFVRTKIRKSEFSYGDRSDRFCA